jgi:glucose-6-phosphate-specific signal transduction histidine kinase
VAPSCSRTRKLPERTLSTLNRQSYNAASVISMTARRCASSPLGSLTNAVKHAQATNRRVNISETPDLATLLLTDDGQGGADSTRDHGGLAGIRRRLNTFDAGLDGLSPEGGSTVVTITAPNIPRTPASAVDEPTA